MRGLSARACLGAAVLAIAVAACASARPPGNEQQDAPPGAVHDAPSGVIDARPIDARPIDARPIDAPPPQPDAAIAVTANQNTNLVPGSASSVTCGNNDDGTSAENSWYRIFHLPDHGVADTFHVTQVTFAVQEATGSPVVQIKVGTYAGTFGASSFPVTQVTPLASTTFTVPNVVSTSPQVMSVPITATVPPGANLAVEIFSPDLHGTAKYFYPGGNANGQTASPYVRMPACGFADPTVASAIGFPNSDLIITVSGTH